MLDAVDTWRIALLIACVPCACAIACCFMRLVNGGFISTGIAKSPPPFLPDITSAADDLDVVSAHL
jgi:hypothetical protein